MLLRLSKMKLKLKDIVLLSLMGALMAAGDFLLEFLPNIHLVGVLIVAVTVVYRKWALLSVCIYVLIQGVAAAFQPWWIPYLYVWNFLWLFVMLIPKKLPEKAKPIVYMAVCAAHGFLFGTLYAPAQAIMFGLDFKGTLAWIAAGLPFDLIHGVSNLLCGLLIYPIVLILQRADKYAKN